MKLIAILITGLLLSGCALVQLQREMEAYNGLLQERVNRGEITVSEANYLSQLKATELNQRWAQIWQGIGNGLQQMDRSSYSHPVQTNCYRVGQHLNCTTW